MVSNLDNLMDFQLQKFYFSLQLCPDLGSPDEAASIFRIKKSLDAYLNLIHFRLHYIYIINFKTMPQILALKRQRQLYSRTSFLRDYFGRFFLEKIYHLKHPVGVFI